MSNLADDFNANWPDGDPTGQLAIYRDILGRYYRWSEAQFITSDIGALLRHRANLFDNLLRHLWQQFALDAFPLALVAVGGYGRETLHPGSDIDLLIVCEDHQPTMPAVGELLTFLWDLHLDVGHSVRTVADCIAQAADDITVATNLVEVRFLTGQHNLFYLLQHAIQNDFPWSSRAFYQAKLAEQQQRHLQYHGTSYNLEPSIKSSPGGLRDLQTIGWIAKQHFRTHTDESLVEYGYMTAEELLELHECMDWLWRIRFALHLEVGKREDRLLFDFQPGVAMRLGYGNEGKRSVELMMKDYFKVVLRVNELNRMLLQFFEQAILGDQDLQQFNDIDNDFITINGLLAARHDDVFADPRNLLRCFLVIAQQPQIQGIQSHTIRLLRNARAGLNEPLSYDADCRALFCQLLAHPQGCGKAFELMHQHSILANYLPQWQQIVGQMQFDLFHAYTVDEHTFRLVRNLYRFTEPQATEDFALCHQLVEKMQRRHCLFIAGIFHDIAKGRGGDHSELGEMDARNFCFLHGYNEAETELVAFLVRHHLLLSVTAQKRDIHDPDVIKTFASQVASVERLDYLYCLTVADIRATNQSLWNNWKATLLEELYRATRELLEQDSAEPALDVRRRIAENKAAAMALLLSAGYDEKAILALWGRFTVDYFFRHSAEQIAWHSQNIIDLSTEQLPLILIGDENNHGFTELFIYHHEESHLFAAVAAVLDSQRLSIHDAQILATRDGYVMDTFVLLQSNGKPLTSSSRIEEVKQQLLDVLHKRAPVPRNQRPLSRRMKNFTVNTRVNFLPSKHQKRTTFELITLDRPGLVAKLAATMQQLNVTVLAAKITTIGEQAEDLFIVSSTAGQALTEQQQQQLKQSFIESLEQ
ncbi:[protein-PII] uridylyltransferase [Idiomarina tyrosinivorans]|uniref:Bifunctional uridylyltransferase/uridylyl-removing enzyme n=1 Tax=Idiomarina tyrosinivorans TaxID=1445662 RepID=A0A432ZRU6_9GAMM|nr:[protein-PII] uridylyltransferase [Idiomarina tyrosinivorans]RUO80558.1 [protein-PII] uridylyltransferase [Idiomarina tyrosinivorans]